MPSGRFKSRTFRRVFTRLPKRTVIHYKRRKPGKAKCGKCGDVLKGVLRALPYRMRTSQKTKKRPSRPYGGVLCSKCSRELIKNKARS
ncbi:MAG: 50S ribosomal protein L34e [Nanoarchaeota archaeon]|nr:50S ribosomal protein L34e [Nanoarchaeota archaeon]MBU1136687.1 50S ribosomal protein L34e [Nanoarchaeota archaeon]